MARRKRGSRDGADKLLGAVLAFFGLVLIAAIVLAALWLRKTKIALDDHDCPISGPKAVNMIMIDRSDPISGQQAQLIRQRVNVLKTAASLGTRFDVYTFEGDIKNEMKPIEYVCAPGRPEEANELIENPEFVRRRYDDKFSAVLDRVIDQLLQTSSLASSPIIESLRAAAITSFGPIKIGAMPLNVVMISDMVQNSTDVSQFKADLSFDQLSKSPRWPALRPNLKGASVEILYLLRPNAKRGAVSIQNWGHQLFWEQLLAASDGRVTMIDPI